jgi:putative membrane protein insertion efficiency factor
MRHILTTPIKVYQKWISPMFAPRCKYYPSCSSYAVTAIETYGLKGIAMSAWRLLRCNPWSHGGVDYVVKPLIALKTIEKTSVGVNK